jgi:hypothetical protein
MLLIHDSGSLFGSPKLQKSILAKIKKMYNYIMHIQLKETIVANLSEISQTLLGDCSVKNPSVEIKPKFNFIEKLNSELASDKPRLKKLNKYIIQIDEACKNKENGSLAKKVDRLKQNIYS